MSPPADAALPIFFEDDIRHRDGGLGNKKYSYEEYKNAGLSTPKVEKSSSFKRKNKPAHLENMMAREMTDPIKNPAVRSDSRNNGRKEQEYNIVLLGDFGVGKTGKYNWEIR